MNIGYRIYIARKANGFSMRELAKKIKISYNAMNKYEKNIIIPPSDVFTKLSKVLNFSINYFLCDNVIKITDLKECNVKY